MFVDEAKIYVQAGNGGKGCESYYKDNYMRHPRPDGGDGGRGGNVVINTSRSIRTLLDYKYKQHYKAENGKHASSKGKKGKEGADCILKVPLGTIIKDFENGLIIKDLNKDQQSIIVAKGGIGGIGNARKKIPLPPKDGEKRTIEFELKLIADVGLIGFPNAGKSTLISKISRVKSKIAGYTFTTKEPILGIVNGEDFDTSALPQSIDFEQTLSEVDNERMKIDFIVADLPGIIEGAHKGRGLGDRFLRHAQRTKILVHVLDMAGSEGRDPLDDYKVLENELKAYSESFIDKKKIIVANKMDCTEATTHLKRFKEEHSDTIIPISAKEKMGLDKLIGLLREKLCQESFQEK